MIHYVEVLGGITLIVSSSVMGRKAMAHVFRCWRDAEPKQWAAVAHSLRRQFPFNFIISGQIYHVQDSRWRWRVPHWLQQSREATRWLRLARFCNFTALLGILLVILGIADLPPN